MKNITISDDVYRKLKCLKAGRTFSETIDELIRFNVGVRIDHLLELGKSATGREDELERLVNGMRKRAKAGFVT